MQVYFLEMYQKFLLKILAMNCCSLLGARNILFTRWETTLTQEINALLECCFCIGKPGGMGWQIPVNPFGSRIAERVYFLEGKMQIWHPKAVCLNLLGSVNFVVLC